MNANEFATLEATFTATAREVDASPTLVKRDVFGIIILTHPTSDRAAGELAAKFVAAYNAWHGTDRVDTREVGTFTEIFLALE